jgi:TetR/AcrR family transcriptional regulator, fatty acid biosynthesis regulator
MLSNVVQLELMPRLAREVVDEVCTKIVLQLFHLSAEYIDADVARRADRLRGTFHRQTVRGVGAACAASGGEGASARG